MSATTARCPKLGDYFATTIGAQPIIMVRDTDDSVKVLYNRCPHKGTRLTGETCGNAGRFFRCPYHAWTFRTDGSLAGVPLRRAMTARSFADGHAARGMTPVRHVHNYRGFVFAKLNDVGLGFEEFFGESAVEPRQHGGPLAGRAGSRWPAACCATCTTAIGRCWSRTRPTPAIRWSRTSRRPAPRSTCGRTRRAGAKKPMAVEIYAPFMSSLRVLREHGHPRLGRTVMAIPACSTRSTPTIRPCPAISSRWSRPTASSAPRRSSTRTATTPSISRT